MHPTPHHRHSLRPAARRLLAFTLAACAAAGGVSFLLSRHAAVSSASAASVSSTAAEATPASSAASAVEEEPGLLSAQQAQAMLDDPRMVLVNHTNKMPEDYTFTTRECGSATAVNKTLQTEAADAFLAMQAAAAREGVTIWMQSGYRSVKYQEGLYNKKTQYYLDKGLSRAEALQKAASIVNPPGYSEHLDTGFEKTAAFRWLKAHAVEYGFILRYPKDAEAVTEITYEPWHWRYVGPENAALIEQSGLCLEDAVALLQKLAAGENTAG